jgi:type I restriction enzyme S subunit
VSWKNVALGELCEVLDSKRKPITKKDRTTGSYPYYGATGIVDYVGDFIFNEKLVLIGEDGAKWDSGDMTAFIADGEYWVNNHAHVIKPLRNRLLDEWLVYYFYYKDLKEFVTGLTVPKLNQGQLKTIPIPLPSVATQQKIVAKLDAIFAEIDTATAAAEENANNAEALFQSFLENIFLRISEANKPLKLSNFIKLEYGKGLEDSDRELNGIYGAYGANGIKSKTNKFLYDKPSIVVGRKGSAGELTLVEEKFWALDVTYYVTHDIKKTDLTFLYYALKMLNIPSLAKGIKPGINRNDVYDLTIAVPILSEQKLLVEKIFFVNKNLEIAKNLYKSKCNELTLLKQSILQKAFSGELVKD